MKPSSHAWVLRLFLLLFFVSLVCFLLVEFSPIDPVNAYLSSNDIVSDEQKLEIAQRYGLDKSSTERYFEWLSGVFRLDLGESVIYRKPVLDVISEKFASSMILMITAWLFSGILGLVSGIFMGLYQDSPLGKTLKSICLALSATPTFFLGILCLMVFSVKLGWFPMGFSVPVGTLAEDVTLWQKIYHLVLPALVLSLASFSSIALHTREKTVASMSSDYMLFAKVRGEKHPVLRHVLPNVLLPFVTLQFASLSEIFGGSILAETVFSYPGLGNTVVDAGLKGDVSLLLGIALFSACFVFCGNFTANLLYRHINPKIRLGNQHE